MIRKWTIRVAAVLSLSGIFACGDRSKVETNTSLPASAAVETAVPDREEPLDGLVMFLTGNVTLISSGAELYPEIGDPVYPGDRLITDADAYVELQFGDFGAIRIQESTEYTVEILPGKSGRGKVIGTLAAGTVMAKVKKLGGNDAFEVKVPGAVCAVRGTEFLVDAQDDGEFTIAVAEGAVSLAPPSLSASEDNPELEEALEQLRNLMPLVSVGEEITARESDFQEAEIRLSSWLLTASESDDAELPLDEIRKHLTAAVAAVPKPAAIDGQRADLIRQNTPEIIPAGLETPPEEPPIELAVEEPAVEESAVEESAVEESAVEESAVEESAVEEPAVEEPAVEESAVALRSSTPVAKTVLEPVLISAKTPIPGLGTGSPVSGGGLAVAASADGTVFAVNEGGEMLWRTPTKNTSESIAPVIQGKRVFALGNKELAILDLNSGAVISRRDLTGDEPNLFGRRPLPLGENIILPTYSGLVFMNPEAQQLGEPVQISDGLQMTPAKWENFVLAANQGGFLHFIDTDSRRIVSEVETASIQPLAQAPAVSTTGIAVFAGRRGAVSAVNLISRTPMWERLLQSEFPVISDAIIDADTAFVYADTSVFALDLRSGEDKYDPITDAAGPPMVSDGTLYVPKIAGTLGLYRSRDGTFLGEIHLEGEVSNARPVALGESVAVFGRESVVIVDPRSIVQR